jgi:ankyrin repeat protein
VLLKRGASAEISYSVPAPILPYAIEHFNLPLFEKEYLEVVDLLLDAGAGVNPEVPGGKDALTLAVRLAYDKIVSVLLDNGGDPSKLEDGLSF